MTSPMRDLKVYTTYPHRCSYLEDQEATTLFLDPRQPVDQSLYSKLSLLGFRRSGNHIYRPHCTHCEACIPARIPVALFRAKPGLKLREDHTFNDEEYNTYACPWHNNLTAAIASFRTAKALKRNPGSTFDIVTFRWHNSTPFEWHSRQLLDLGLMEPGQWF